MAMKERHAISFSGWFALVLGLGLLAASVVSFAMIKSHQQAPAPYVAGGIVMSLAGILMRERRAA